MANETKTTDPTDFTVSCQLADNQPYFSKTDSGIIIQNGTLDRINRTASVEFIRPFDVSSD